MQVEWYGQSAFRLNARRGTVVIDPFGDMSGAGAAGACSSTTRRSTALQAELVLVTHEHADHNGVEVVGGDPAILRSTAGTARVADRRGGRDRLRAR